LGHINLCSSLTASPTPSGPSEWALRVYPVRRSPSERRLAQRQPWMSGGWDTLPKQVPGDLDEPSWKSLCQRSTKTELLHRSAHPYRTGSPIPSRKRRSSLSRKRNPCRTDHITFATTGSSNRSGPVGDRPVNKQRKAGHRAESVSSAANVSLTDSTESLHASDLSGERRTAASQTKKFIGVCEKCAAESEFAHFERTLPRSRKAALAAPA
jgi:hypothetical protein